MHVATIDAGERLADPHLTVAGGTDAPASLAGRIAAPPRAHPRLFLANEELPTLQRRCLEDPLLSRVMSAIRMQAEMDLRKPLVRYEVVGRRLLDVSRTCLARVVRCAFLWRIDGDRRHLERAREEMLAAAGFSDWNPSHFLDTAEMTAALAIGYDWLFHELDASARQAIRAAIVYNGLMAFQGNRRPDNWNQVCNGGMTLGALAVIEDEQALAERIILQAVTDIPLALHAYEPDGVYPEGPMYWSYGTSFNLLMIAALESALGTDAGLTTPALMSSGAYFAHMIGPTGRFFNYGDCNPKPGIEPSLAWLSERNRDPLLAWSLRTTILHSHPSSIDRLAPFVLIWWKSGHTSACPTEHLHYLGNGRTPVAVHRSGWTADATYVAIKGGSAATNHAHMDAGSFVIDSDGVRWAGDLGMQDYHSLESHGINLWNTNQTSDRWSVFRIGSASHSVLQVDGERQRVSGSAPIAFHDASRTILDLSSVYEQQLASAQRCIRLLPDHAVVIQDSIAALPGKPAVVRWAMPCETDAAIVDPRTAVLTSAGKQRFVRILSPGNAAIRLYPCEQPPSSFDAPNPGVHLIGFEVSVPAGASATLLVQIAPPGAEVRSPDDPACLGTRLAEPPMGRRELP
ncbi:MAG: heparinase II/III family protein [Planctomycetes bacterium]|nr:heparinase II/III family protein [Planctomycetota bacterium]